MKVDRAFFGSLILSAALAFPAALMAGHDAGLPVNNGDPRGASGVKAAPSAPPPASAPAPGVKAAPAQTRIPAGTQILQNDKYYTYASLDADTRFETSLPVGSDIEFELGESVSDRQVWRFVSCDPAVCRVKLEHDQDGFFPFRRDKAEIELKAVGRGSTDVVFSGGEKKVTVHFTGM